MGQSLKNSVFTAEQYGTFHARLEQELEVLKQTLQAPQYNQNKPSLGAELEMYLADSDWLPTAKNQWLLDECNNPLLQPELNQYNIEFNLAPVNAKGDSLNQLQKQLDVQLDELRSKCHQAQTRIIPIGILPTLDERHLSREFLTNRPRYNALSQQLGSVKDSAFEVNIKGLDELQMQSDEVTLEGANTSFQVHLRVPYSRFADTYNAAQLVTPLSLALAGNSPIFMGKRLWQETRIALFKQSIDGRMRGTTEWRQPARVSFGHGWMRHGVWENFAENVALYPAILPQVPDNVALEEFKALQMHHGTIWSWNRSVLDVENEHLRIEFRTLPAGPSNIDMVANAAVLIGWTVALSKDINVYLCKLPFRYAEYNFYRSAKEGLDAEILWPQKHQHNLTTRNVCDVIADMLPMAADGLATIGVNRTDIDFYLGVIEKRLASRQTGATWQINTLNRFKQTADNTKALKQMVEQYTLNNISGLAVADWD